MEKFIGMLLAAAVITGAQAYAGCGDCGTHKAEAKKVATCPVSGQAAKAACGGKSCQIVDGSLASLKLSDEQKSKVEALKQECAKATSTSECKATCEAGMGKILDAEQLKLWKASASQCAKPAKAEAKADVKGAKKACCPGH